MLLPCCSVLLGIRTAIAALSGSLSVIVTVIDAFLDVVSGGLLYYTSYLSRVKRDPYRYPIGRVRTPR
jgi:divalent metal cation (Fe/Co/Zn/Cd) transporter